MNNFLIRISIVTLCVSIVLAQNVNIIIQNFCPLNVIAKCNSNCGKADTLLAAGASVSWTGMPK